MKRPRPYNARRCRSGHLQWLRYRVDDKTRAERRMADRAREGAR